MTEPHIKGSCLCGQVQFAIQPPFRGFQYCHCSRCRKASGTAHASNIFVPGEAFEWLAGQALVRTWKLPDARYFTSAFCEVCGSKAPWETAGGKNVVVPAGALDDDPGQAPTRSVHFASRGAWYRHVSALPSFDETPPSK